MIDWRLIDDNTPKDREILLAGQWLGGGWDVKIGQWLINRFPFVGQGGPTHWAEVEPPA